MSKLTIITGNGKGKTTTAMGIVVQAAFIGKQVYFGQFMKQGDYSEIAALKANFKNVTIEQYQGNMVINRGTVDDDYKCAQDGLKAAKASIESNKYDLIVLDELNVALFLELISLDDVLELIALKGNAHMALSGRYAHDDIIAVADECYEVKEIKHYYTQGVQARIGIEM